MSRCAYCRHLIWPWQRRGWRVISLTGRKRMWHAQCWSQRPSAVASLGDPDVYEGLRDALIHRRDFDDRGYSHVDCGAEEDVRERLLIAAANVRATVKDRA